MLVNYSSSSSSSEDELKVVSSSRKRRRRCNTQETRVPGPGNDEGACQVRFPLPASVMEMFRDSEEQQVDDCSQHGGRIRSFQHERGNWATYVYVPYDPEGAFLDLLDELRVCAAARGVTLTPAEEFHISLSQTAVLRHHWIQTFVCLADKLKVYSNDEKTRTFLGVEVSAGRAQLLELAKRVDEVMEGFELSTYYEDPSFHVSLAWCVGDLTEKLQRCVAELQSLVDGHEDGPFQMKLHCKELRCKAGNKCFRFLLQ